MTDKDFTSKLAAGMRRAKQPAQAESSVPPTATPPSAASTKTSAARPTTAASSANREGPWKDLHPKRIWPD